MTSRSTKGLSRSTRKRAERLKAGCRKRPESPSACEFCAPLVSPQPAGKHMPFRTARQTNCLQDALASEHKEQSQRVDKGFPATGGSPPDTLASAINSGIEFRCCVCAFSCRFDSKRFDLANSSVDSEPDSQGMLTSVGAPRTGGPIRLFGLISSDSKYGLSPVSNEGLNDGERLTSWVPNCLS